MVLVQVIVTNTQKSEMIVDHIFNECDQHYKQNLQQSTRLLSQFQENSFL